MAKTGLINDILGISEANFKTHTLFLGSKEFLSHNDGLKEMLVCLKKVYATKDIHILLGTEELLLRQELNRYANSSEEVDVVVKGLEQIQEAKRALSTVQKPKEYQIFDATLAARNKDAGLPMDAMRLFLKSQSARLSNQMTGNLSVPEKNILRQRKENLGMVKDIYMTMQREALGMPAPKISRGRGR
jgi:hypothetical protein